MTAHDSSTTDPRVVESEIAKEQAHVDRVRAQLEIAENKARMLAKAGQDMYRSDRTSWVREEDGTAMFERDAFSYNAAKRLAVLDAEHEGLVFGRLDLTDDEVRHIGRIGVRDADYEPLVIDWRARAAEPFYRATPSDPMGVVRRRVLRCRDDKVLGIEDDLLDSTSQANLPIIGEGALMASLSRARDTRMHSIVSTIQAEQDEAIRAPYQGVTTIMGGPGTGKTVVALHRAAFLLYSHRTRLENGGVLVIGPSSVFMSYIERVLPSLGEDSVTLRSVGQVPSDILRFSSDRLDEPRTANIKGSLEMVDVLTRLVNLPMSADPDSLQLRVTVKGEVLTLDASILATTRQRILKRNRYNDGREAVEVSLRDQLWARVPADVLAAHDLTRDDFDELVSSQASWRMLLNAWWPALSASDALARLADPAVAEAVTPYWNEETRQLLVSSIPTEADRRGRRNWSIADMALLDELAALLGPVPPEPDADDPVFIEGGDAEELVTLGDRLHESRHIDEDEPRDTFAHVLVDEAQDISPMQWRMIGRRGRQASWTIVGDPAQSAFPHPNQTRAALDELVGNSPSRTFTLTKNYRSPAEVFDIAADVVVTVQPDADLPQAVRWVGVRPTVVRTDDLWAQVRLQLDEMLTSVDGTIGLVCPAGLVEQARRLVDDPRIITVTTMQAKGLEYDGAVVVDPERIVSETGNPAGGVRLLYVALTRPTQRLAVVGLRKQKSPHRSEANQPVRGAAAPAWSEALWSHETC